jgi:hypothetical protein
MWHQFRPSTVRSCAGGLPRDLLQRCGSARMSLIFSRAVDSPDRRSRAPSSIVQVLTPSLPLMKDRFRKAAWPSNSHNCSLDSIIYMCNLPIRLQR